MEIKKLIHKYLQEGRVISVATFSGDQPWSFNAYFAADENFNLYWISNPDTRHSKEIQNNSKVAATIPIRFADLNVVGLQVEGNAEIVKNEDEINQAVRLYTDKFQRGEDWYKDFIAGKNEHKLYRIKPRLFVLFDRENFPENSRKEYTV